MPWKKSLRVLKIVRIQTLLSCHAMWIYFLLSLWDAWFKNKPNIWLCYRASCPTECRFHLDSPLPISLWPLAFPPLTRASCMPRSFFIGKKREMYEHPVFCLASQVMDLTIREYLHHPLPSLPPSPPSFERSFTSSPFLPLPFLQRCCSYHARFYLCLLSVRVSGERSSREIWAAPRWISRGPFLFFIL